MEKKYLIKRFYIPKQNNIYNFKEELFDFGLEWDSKKNYYYNPYEISPSNFDELTWLCKKNEFSYEVKEEEYKGFEESIEGMYTIISLTDVVFAIKNRKNGKFSYLISLFACVEGDVINVVDNERGNHFSFKTKLQDYKSNIFAIFNILNTKKEIINKNTEEINSKFNLDDFLKIMSILMNEYGKKDEVYGNINKFKFYTISKMQESCFLCNCVKGFSPETSFSLYKGKIKNTLTKNFIGQEQEQKVWKFLYYNRDRVGVEKKLTLYDLFVGARIPINLEGFETKLPINRVDSDYGNLIVSVFDGNKSLKLNKTFTRDELWKIVVENR